MRRDIWASDVDLQARLGAARGAREIAWLGVTIVLFIVLAGIWACLWVPPS